MWWSAMVPIAMTVRRIELADSRSEIACVDRGAVLRYLRRYDPVNTHHAPPLACSGRLCATPVQLADPIQGLEVWNGIARLEGPILVHRTSRGAQRDRCGDLRASGLA